MNRSRKPMGASCFSNGYTKRLPPHRLPSARPTFRHSTLPPSLLAQELSNPCMGRKVRVCQTSQRTASFRKIGNSWMNCITKGGPSNWLTGCTSAIPTIPVGLSLGRSSACGSLRNLQGRDKLELRSHGTIGPSR